MELIKILGQMFVHTFRTDLKQIWFYTWDYPLSYNFNIII